jgi:hypothetical protein
MTTATLERRKVRSFPKGKKRYVCVNRNAIVANLQEKKKYPTVIVVEDGTLHEFHEAKADGTLKFDDTRNDLPAKVFIETEEEVIAVTDEAAEPTFLKLPPKPKFSLTKLLLDWLEPVPLVGCVVHAVRGPDNTTPVEKPPEPKPQPKPEPVTRYRTGCG